MKGQVLNSDELPKLADGLKLNDMKKYDNMLTGYMQDKSSDHGGGHPVGAGTAELQAYVSNSMNGDKWNGEDSMYFLRTSFSFRKVMLVADIITTTSSGSFQ